jgi:hypothetical protein
MIGYLLVVFIQVFPATMLIVLCVVFPALNTSVIYLTLFPQQ